MRRVSVVAHGGANAGNLVGRNRNAHARAADQNAARRLSAVDGFTHPLGKIGIVVLGIDLVRAQIDHLVAGLGEIRPHLFLERKAGVVGADN